MNSIIEALPELVISLVLFGVFYLAVKNTLSAKVLHRISLSFAGGIIIAIVLLLQSGSPPTNRLQVQESFASSESELAEQKDLSPETLTEAQSSERLKALISAQKDSVSLSKPDEDTQKNDDPN